MPMREELKSLHFIAALLSGKWSLSVVYSLNGRTRRYHEIRKRIPTATSRMLSATLRKLEQDGLVTRTIHPTIPPRVEYQLTPLGLEVLAVTKQVTVLTHNSPLFLTAREKRITTILQAQPQNQP